MKDGISGGALGAAEPLRIAVELPWDASSHMGTGAYSETMVRALSAAAPESTVLLITPPDASPEISLENVEYYPADPVDVREEGFRQVSVPSMLEELDTDCLFAPSLGGGV